jgi:hypothetical protein
MPRQAAGSPVRIGCLLLVMAAGPAFVLPGAAQPGPDLLERVQAFAERYRRESPSLVAEERYVQNVTYTRGGQPKHREMTSELVMVRLPGSAGWVTLRDVLVVDKRRLHDREERLLKLLQSPQADAFARASELARESARFNLGSVNRTINVPDVAIEYLLPQHTGRMQFDAPKSVTVDGAAVEMFRFREVRGPSIVRDPRGADLRAEGRVWADPASGEIVRTELILRDRQSSGTNTVDFHIEPRLSMRVPVKMTERYTMPGELIDSVATYTNFRSFAVATTEKLTKPPQ